MKLTSVFSRTVVHVRPSSGGRQGGEASETGARYPREDFPSDAVHPTTRGECDLQSDAVHPVT